MVSSLLDDIIEQFDASIEVIEEDAMKDAPQENEMELSAYEKLRNQRIKEFQAEFRSKFPNFEEEVLKLKVTRKKCGGKRKTSHKISATTRSSRGVIVDNLVQEKLMSDQMEKVSDTVVVDEQSSVIHEQPGLLDDQPVPLDDQPVLLDDQLRMLGDQHGVETVISDEQVGHDGDHDQSVLGKYGCVPCDMRFRDTGHLRRHVLLMHVTRTSPVSCPRTWCIAEFTILADMIKHKETCLLACPYPDCDKTFIWEKPFSAHQRAHQIMARRMSD